MKKILFGLFFLTGTLFGQTLSYFQVGGYMLQNLPNDSLQTTFKGMGSLGVSWGKEYNYYIGKSKIFAGFGYEFNLANYRFDNNVEFGRDLNDKIYFTHNTDTMIDYVKSKLYVGALQIPVQIGIYTKKFLFEVGGFGGIVVNSVKKEKFEILPTTLDKTQRFVVSSASRAKNTAVNIFQYGAFVRTGYKSFGAYVKYYLSGFFDTNKLYSSSYNTVIPLEFGISFFFVKKKNKKVFDFPSPENKKKTNNI